MMKYKLLLCCLITVMLIIVGCGSQDSAVGDAPGRAPEPGPGYDMPPPQEDVDHDPTGGQRWEETEPRIIKNAEMRVEVEDLEQALRDVNIILAQLEASIANSWLENWDHVQESTLIIRVPQRNFDVALNELEALGDMKSRNIRTQDVTEEYVDLTARLSVYKEQETAFLRLLAQAESIEDILSVERELRPVRVEIERLTGRMRYLDNRVELSTITLYLTARRQPTVTPIDSFPAQIKYALQDGWGVFLAVITGFFVRMVWLSPFLVIIILLGWLLLHFIRWARRK